MITFSQLGRYGELGNQLFQIAATIGYATRVEQEYGFPLWHCTKSDTKYFELFKERLPLLECINLKDFTGFSESSLRYNEIPSYLTCNVNLFGYFQCERYFAHCKDVIINQFQPSEIIQQKINHLNYEDSVCIQLRFYDRVSKDPFDVYVKVEDNLDYLKAAINFFGKKKTFYVVTNNPDKAEAIFKGYTNIVVLREYSNIEQFFIQTMCEHNIITNSSFGWWGAYLNQTVDKIVYAPKKWFCREDDAWCCSKDLIPESWRKC